jgi:uncharacterized protein YdaU (DUF1376 family)
MPKDPAVLLYTSDFLSGTITMENEEVGMYIRLLCLQHQKGKLTEKDMLSICKGYVQDVYDKFDLVDGYYINKRMYEEAEKRSKYTESRRNNAKKGAYEKHMHNHMENEDVNEDINENININTLKVSNQKKQVTYPNWDEFLSYGLEKEYTEEDLKGLFDYYTETNWCDAKGKKVLNWKAKLISLKQYKKPQSHGTAKKSNGEIIIERHQRMQEFARKLDELEGRTPVL